MNIYKNRCICITEMMNTEEKKVCLLSLSKMGVNCPQIISNVNNLKV